MRLMRADYLSNAKGGCTVISRLRSLNTSQPKGEDNSPLGFKKGVAKFPKSL